MDVIQKSPAYYFLLSKSYGKNFEKKNRQILFSQIIYNCISKSRNTNDLIWNVSTEDRL